MLGLPDPLFIFHFDTKPNITLSIENLTRRVKPWGQAWPARATPLDWVIFKPPLPKNVQCRESFLVRLDI